MTLDDRPYWCLALGPFQRFEVADGTVFATYADMMQYIETGGLAEAAQRGDITLLVSRGIPEGIAPFLPLLRATQRP